jgi:hypothetical protein
LHGAGYDGWLGDDLNPKARCLTEAVLQGIRTDVFNVSAPIGP